VGASAGPRVPLLLPGHKASLWPGQAGRVAVQLGRTLGFGLAPNFDFLNPFPFPGYSKFDSKFQIHIYLNIYPKFMNLVSLFL
jgi:hypothetical protein